MERPENTPFYGIDDDTIYDDDDLNTLVFPEDDEMCDDGYGPGSFYDEEDDYGFKSPFYDEEDDYGFKFPFYDEEGMDDDDFVPPFLLSDDEDMPEAVYDPYLEDTEMDDGGGWNLPWLGED